MSEVYEALNDVYFEEEIKRTRNRKALLLAQARFAAQIQPFVMNNPARLSYVEGELSRIIAETSAETGADEDYVSDRFRRYVADAVAVSEPEHIDLDGDREESLPPAKFDPAKVNPEPDATTSVLDYGMILEDEVYEPDAKIDLNENTLKSSCYRCSKELNPVVASASKVCLECAGELAKLADASPLALPNGQVPQVQPGTPVDPNARVTCPYCAAKGYHFEGTATEYQQHVTQQHQQELQQQQQMGTLPVQGKLKFAAPEDMTPPNPAPTGVSADEGLSEQGNPVHHFDDVVQTLANDAAAIQFSAPSDEEVQQIAERYGLDAKTVKDKLFVTATFGDSKAANGTASDDITAPDGYTEIDMEGMGGQVQTHDAQVPYDLARNKVSQDLKIQPDLVDSMLKDSYGGDLSDEYHASVSGEHRYYLPQDIVGAQEQQPQQQPDPKVGPTPQPAQQQQPLAPQPVSTVVRVSLADLLEADRRRLVRQKR